MLTLHNMRSIGCQSKNRLFVTWLNSWHPELSEVLPDSVLPAHVAVAIVDVWQLFHTTHNVYQQAENKLDLESFRSCLQPFLSLILSKEVSLLAKHIGDTKGASKGLL